MGTEQVFAPTEVLWALSGLILTIAGNWLEAFITNAPWFWGPMGIHISSLGVNCQVGAVLLTGCMGGEERRYRLANRVFNPRVGIWLAGF